MEVSLSVLIVHHDAAERKLVKSVLRGFRLEVEALDDGARAAKLVQRQKFDGVFLDGDLPENGSLELVREIRQSPSNKKAPIVFITNQDSSIGLGDAFEAGVTFFLTRPLDQKKVQRLLNATRGAMLAERRRYHRVPVVVPVRFKAGPQARQGSSLNISRSGILFEAWGVLAPGETVEIEVGLPQPAGTIHALGEVVRVDPEGRVGVRFKRLAAAELEQLQNFIGI